MKDRFIALIRSVLFFFGIGYGVISTAGINYSLIENHALAGQNITVRAIVFNDEPNAIHWTPPAQLVLQWHHPGQTTIRSVAHLKEPAQTLVIPVNAFSLIEWDTRVPLDTKDLQVISIEGTTDLLALNTSAKDNLPSHQQEKSISPVINTTAENTPTTSYSQQNFDRFRSALSAYEPIYFLMGTEPQSNARFQLSFKYRLFNPKDDKKTRLHQHLYLAYTQRSLWDLSSDSMPFIDTTYNPSFFWHQEKLWQKEAQPFYLGLSTGIEHASNGKTGTNSRSLNDLYVQPEFNYMFNGGSTLSFMPRVKKYIAVSSENKDYKDYMGAVEWKMRWRQEYGLSVTGSYQQGKQGRKTSQIDVSWPLKRTPFNMNGYLYAQYYRGYGETLLRYNQRSQSQVRFGLALTP